MEEFLYFILVLIAAALSFVLFVAFDLKNNWLVKRAKSFELRLEKRDKMA